MDALKGVLLINLGSPDSPSVKSVRKYLRQFLLDPFVIDVPFLFRWLLVQGLIVPFRSPKSARAYQKIWLAEGSPLVHYGKRLRDLLQKKLGDGFCVEIAMRYGEPSIAKGIGNLLQKGVSELTIMPLYPQYALASTESSLAEVDRILQQSFSGLSTRIVPDFFDHPGFLKAFAACGRSLIQQKNPDHVLFSFHGLPERQIAKAIAQGKPSYYEHCLTTAHGIAAELGLDKNKYSISFQSRLGPGWLTPFTDQALAALPKKGIRTVAVFCPSFVADCLETLEEIGIRGREIFCDDGGEELYLVPCPNDSPQWVEVLASIFMERIPPVLNMSAPSQ